MNDLPGRLYGRAGRAILRAATALSKFLVSLGSESFSGCEVACGERERGGEATRRSPGGRRNDPRKRCPPSLSNPSPGSFLALFSLSSADPLFTFSIRLPGREGESRGLPHLRSFFPPFFFPFVGILAVATKGGIICERAAAAAVAFHPLLSLSLSRLEQQCRCRRR